MSYVTTENLGDGVFCITLNRPEKLNAFNLSMKYELNDAFIKFSTEPELRVALLCAAGRAFSSGADREELSSGRLFQGMPAHHIIDHGSRVKPIIACVQGNVIGMALGLILECDLIVAADDVRFTVGETILGLPTERYYSLIEYSSGPRFAADVTLTGREFFGVEALENGLINRICPREKLEQEGLHLGKSISKLPARGIEGGVRTRAARIHSINKAWAKLLAASDGIADDMTGNQ